VSVTVRAYAERLRSEGVALRAATAAALEAEEPVEHVAQALLRPPLYNGGLTSGLGTLYTAAYRPAEGRVSYVWPGGQH
jgi:hypothetical protein